MGRVELYFLNCWLKKKKINAAAVCLLCYKQLVGLRGSQAYALEAPLAVKVIHGHMTGEKRKQIKSLSFFCGVGCVFAVLFGPRFMHSHHNLGSKKPSRITRVLFIFFPQLAPIQFPVTEAVNPE